MRHWIARSSAVRLALLPILAGIFILVPISAFCGAFDISPGTEIQTGKEAASWIEKNYPISKDPVLNAKLEKIGRRLAQAAERKDLPYEFHIIADPEVNAISLPGGYIYCFQGLIQALPSDDALAFVIAHEMIHAAKRHWAASMEKSTTLSVLTLGYAAILNIVLVPHYSREAEREADKLGMQIAAHSGFDPDGAVEAMTTLTKIAGSRKGGLPIFRSHPSTDTRLAYLKELAEKLKTEGVKPNETAPPPPPAEVAIYEPSGFESTANDYQPLAAGDRWIYRFTDGKGGRLRQEVNVVESVAENPGVFRVESRLGEDVSVKYLLATTKSALLRRIELSVFDQARGKSAQWEMLYPLPSSEAVPAGFRMGTVERVETPFKTFDAVKVEKLNEKGEATRTAWFASGVGLVKESWPNGVTKVLEEYRPGRISASDTPQ